MLLSQCQAPVCGGSLVTNIRRSTVARLAGATPPFLNSTTTGMACPYVTLSPMYRWASMRLPGRAIVVNFVVLVPALPALSLAVTAAVYVVEYFSGPAGTHDDLSARQSPSTALPPASVSLTPVSEPALSFNPISADTGTSFAFSAGVTVKSAVAVPGECHAPLLSDVPPVHAERLRTKATIR